MFILELMIIELRQCWYNLKDETDHIYETTNAEPDENQTIDALYMRGLSFKSHLGQRSVCNRKASPQNKLYIYIHI